MSLIKLTGHSVLYDHVLCRTVDIWHEHCQELFGLQNLSTSPLQDDENID